MPEKSEQPIVTLPLTAQLEIPFLTPEGESAAAIIDSCLRRFDGNKAILAALRKLDEEIAAVSIKSAHYRDHASMGSPSPLRPRPMPQDLRRSEASC